MSEFSWRDRLSFSRRRWIDARCVCGARRWIGARCDCGSRESVREAAGSGRLLVQFLLDVFHRVVELIDIDCARLFSWCGCKNSDFSNLFF